MGPLRRLLLLRFLYRLVTFCSQARVQFYGLLGQFASWSGVWPFFDDLFVAQVVFLISLPSK
jgi:hypothetical protein